MESFCNNGESRHLADAAHPAISGRCPKGRGEKVMLALIAIAPFYLFETNHRGWRP